MFTAERLKYVDEYYFSKKMREVNSYISSGRPIINMAIGSPDLSPSLEVKQALSESIDHQRSSMYQSYVGLPELRGAISNFYNKQYGVEINPLNEILPLMGSKEGVMHISMAFLNKGDGVLIPNPGYPTYGAVSKLLGADIFYYSLSEKNNWYPKMDDLENLNPKSIKLMWINYPHMPTGADFDEKKLNELISWAHKNDIILINDNPYSFILNKKPRSILSLKNSKGVAIELNSLSKSFNMAGWRVGMMVGESKFIDAVLKVKSNFDSGMFYCVQYGAIRALASSHKWFETLNKEYYKRRKLVEEIASELNLSYSKNGVGMFIWCKMLDESLKSEDFVDHLLDKYNFFISPGSIFGSQGEGYVRISLCTETKNMNEVLKRLRI
ncbi:MAG: pyridoxal phosphate-dependent aminotransferase [Flavobacteriaceae bacterium]